MALPTNLLNNQIWPIKAKGAVTRLNPLGDPEVEKFYHKALEQGRMLETSLGDANNWLAERKREVLARIQTMLDINKVAINAQPKRKLRKILLAANSISFLNEVSHFQQEIVGLIQAATQNIGIIQSMEQNMLRMIQANLNAVSNLLHDICNWGLPNLPAIPNFFSDTIWYWNGFNFFPLAAFKPHVGFDKNFAFNQCVIHIPNINIFRNYPNTIQSYSGLQYGTPAFVPPLGGVIPNTGQNLSDPNFIAQMQVVSTTPVYGPDFNPNSSMLGSVPDPVTIINNYQMPSATYRANIVAIVPATRQNTVEPKDSDYNNPNLVVRKPKLRTDLVHFTTLKEVVASNFEPNLTAEWLFYLDETRTGRGGNWIRNFQTLYDTLVAPSIPHLATNNIPWNNVLGGNGVVAGPQNIPFVSAVQNAADSFVSLWKLSYVESSLLGYTRTKDWDDHATLGYIDDFTGADLDYRSTPIDSTVTSTVVLGAETASFPTLCTFPSAIAATLSKVIEKAKVDIANNPRFRSPHPQFRFTFNSFAQATEVDRFSQFWREFNANLQVLLVQDPYLVGFAVTYPDSLNSAINPLGDPAIFNLIKSDVASRSRTWTPGTPLIDIPIAPVVTFTSNEPPTDANSGWQGLDLNPSVFLARPDIQGQPIPVQIAMLRTNLSFAAINKFSQDMQAEVAAQLAIAQQTIELTNVGFQVSTVSLTDQEVAATTIQNIGFDAVDFDISNYVIPTPPATVPTDGAPLYNTFVIQQAGTYSVAGTIAWGAGDVGIRSVIIYNNGSPIFQSDDNPEPGPIASVPFSTIGQFNQGDEITVAVSHNLAEPQTVTAGSMFTMFKTQDDPNAGGFPVDNDNPSTKTFTAAADIVAGTVVHINGSGEVESVDPTTIVTDANGNVVFPFADGIVMADVLAGNPAQVATTYGGDFSIPSLSLTPGGLLFVRRDGRVTQDYASLLSGSVSPGTDATVGPVQWIICVGRAHSSDAFLWEPHIPSRFNMKF
jgi:hypothetical protein